MPFMWTIIFGLLTLVPEGMMVVGYNITMAHPGDMSASVLGFVLIGLGAILVIPWNIIGGILTLGALSTAA